MRAKMPFDTEKERKTVKFFSWRQIAYISVAILLYIQLFQSLFSPNFSFIAFVVLVVSCIPVTFPFLFLAFVQNKESGYFMDKHIYYSLNHDRTQSGVWRKR